MKLSVATFQSRGQWFIGVIKHPDEQTPNAKSYDVVYVAGSFVRPPRLGGETETRIIKEAQEWADSHDPEATGVLAEFSRVRLRRAMKAAYRQSRLRRAKILRALRQGVPLETIRQEHGDESRDVLRRLMRRWPRLKTQREEEYRQVWPRQPRYGRRTRQTALDAEILQAFCARYNQAHGVEFLCCLFGWDSQRAERLLAGKLLLQNNELRDLLRQLLGIFPSSKNIACRGQDVQ